MSHKDAPPETPTQTTIREWYTARLASRGIIIGWGRDKNGKFMSEYAQTAEAAWVAAQANISEPALTESRQEVERLRKALHNLRNVAHTEEGVSLAAHIDEALHPTKPAEGEKT